METLSPTRCVACDMPGEILCASCADALPYIDPRLACPRCGAPYGHVLCTECPQPGSEEALAHPEEAFPFAQARCALSFEGGARKLVRAYKDQDELRLDAVIASLVCAAMRGRTMGWRGEVGGAMREHADADASCARRSKRTLLRTHFEGASRSLAQNDRHPEGGAFQADWTQWADALAYVPASPEAVLRRDFDHLERIAKKCARRTGLPLLDALVAIKGAHDQRKLDRHQRRANRRSSFALSSGRMHVPAHVVLIDDVFTTGATLSAATELLLEAGAREVRVVTCCRVW